MSKVSFGVPAFLCPLCQVHSQQTWVAALERLPNQIGPYNDLYWSICLNCQGRTIWYRQQLVAPVSSSAPPANPDMPADVMFDFEEARQIVHISPRAAAALLRLCVQKLTKELGATGDNLNRDIG